MHTLDIFGIEPVLYCRDIQIKKLAKYEYSTSLLSFPHPSSSSFAPEETLHYDEIRGFTSLIPVLTMGLIDPIFHRKGPLLLFRFLTFLCFLQRHLRKVSFFYILLDRNPLNFSNSALYGDMVMIFSETFLEDLLHYLCIVVKLKAVNYSDL